QQVPNDPDVIRVAFIYNPDRVEPVGESRIFEDERFTGTAREPLAQEFKPVDEDVTETFVAVANHFKSKGSIAGGDADQGDGQGNNANLRVSQAEAVLDHLAKQSDWQDKATFVMGDLNSYTREHAIDTFRDAGYSIPQEDHQAATSYQFDGMLGSLDHVLANANVDVQDAQVWNINADESIAFEYSRRLYNVVDYHDDSPSRSSGHDPVKGGCAPETTDDNGDGGYGAGDGRDGSDGDGPSNAAPGAGSAGSSAGGILGAIPAIAAALGLSAIFSGTVDQYLPREAKSFRDQIRAFFNGLF